MRAAYIATCVGSLSSATVRTADLHVLTLDGPLEIIELSGTIATNGVHFHLSAADKDGIVTGGHVKHGCKVQTTAEIIIVELDDMHFTREPDEETGFDELKITARRD